MKLRINPYNNIIILGPAGSGKSTLSTSFAVKHNFCHIALGEIFRSEMSRQTRLGLEISDYYNRKILTPDSIVFKIVRTILIQNKSTIGFIFDGFPRTKLQALQVDNALKDILSTRINCLIILETNEENLINRITNRKTLANRKEDQDYRSVSERVRSHLLEKSWVEVADYYVDKTHIINVDASISQELVFDVVSKELSNYITF